MSSFKGNPKSRMIMTRTQLESLCADLPTAVRTELLEHARVTRAVAMRAFDVRDDETFKKIVDANPNLVHRLPGEIRMMFRSTEIVRLLSRCAALGEGVKK
jgi:hypothetical protein